MDWYANSSVFTDHTEHFLLFVVSFRTKKNKINHMHMAGIVLVVGNNYFYVYRDIDKHQSLFQLSSAVLSNANTSEMVLGDSCRLVLRSPTGWPKASSGPEMC